MRRIGILLVLLLTAATPAEDNRLYRAAQAAFENKLWEIAERHLTDLLQRSPNFDKADRASLLLGQAQLQAGKASEAAKSLETAINRWPDKLPDANRFWLAEAYSTANRWDLAAKRYLEVVDEHPRSPLRPQALYGLGYVQFKQGHFVEASGTLDRLFKAGFRAPGSRGGKPPLQLQAELLRGQIDLALNRFEAADATFAGLLKETEGSAIFYQTQLWLGESLARQKKAEQALAHFAVITEAFAARAGKPVEPALATQAWYAAGWANSQLARHAEAGEAYAQALALATSPAIKRDALLKLGEAYLQSGKRPEGIARLREFLKTHPTDLLADEVQMALGDLLLGAQDFAGAQAEYSLLLKNYPTSRLVPKATYNAGWCAWQAKQPDESIQFFTQAVQLASDPAIVSAALFKLADAQFALGQYPGAITNYQRLVTQHASVPQLDRALFQLGEAHRRARDFGAASNTFARLVGQFAASEFAPEAQFSIGQIAATTGNEPAARRALERVVAVYGKSPWAREALLAIGESLYRERAYPQAQQYFEQLMGNGTETNLIHRAFYHRGWCLAAQGQADKTLAEFTDFLKQHPRSSLAPDIQFWVADQYLARKDYLKAQEQYQLLARDYATSKLADAAQYYAGRAAYLRQDYTTAIESFQALLKNFPESAWRCDARFAQGDALSELGQFEDALVVFENLLQQFADCSLACDAAGRKGDCQATLNRLDEAITSYRRALDCARTAAQRNQALFKLGQCYERKEALDDALQAYSLALFGAIAAPDPQEPPERFWSPKAARAAATLRERQAKWQDAITLYQKLAEVSPELKSLAEDRIRKIRVEHFIWN